MWCDGNIREIAPIAEVQECDLLSLKGDKNGIL